MAIRGVKFDEDLSPMVASPMRAAGGPGAPGFSQLPRGNNPP